MLIALIRRAGWVVLCLGIAFALYAPGLHGAYFADDYQFVFDRPADHIFRYVTQPNLSNGFYRPIQAGFLAAVQAWVGMATWPIHVVQIALHAGLALWVGRWMRQTGATGLQACIATLFLLTTPAAVHAVQSNDTLSQGLGTLCGTLAVGWWLRSYAPKAQHNRMFSFAHNTGIGPVGSRSHIGDGIGAQWGWRCGACFMLAVALLAKETSAGFVPMLAVAAWTGRRQQGTPAFGAVWRAGLDWLPVLAIAGLYWYVRMLVLGSQVAVGESRYQFALGVNVLKNTGLLALAAGLPVSTVELFAMLRGGANAQAGMMGLLAGLWGFVIFLGLCCARQGAWLATVAVFALLAMLPAVLLNHVGELYAYNLLPFVAVLVGLGVGRLLELLRRQPVGATVLVLILLIVAGNHVWAVRGKVAGMVDNGQRAQGYLEQLEPIVYAMPEHGELWLIEPPVHRPQYSVFTMDGFRVLHFAIQGMLPRWDRPEVSVHWLNLQELIQATAGPQVTLLTLHEGRLVELNTERTRP